MATIQRRTTTKGEARYTVSIRLKGGRKTHTFKRLSDARRWAQKQEVEIREERAWGRAVTKKATVGEVLDRYMREWLDRLADSSRPRVEAQLRFWRERLGSVQLADLHPDLIARVLSELAESGRSPATRNRYHAALSKALQVAVKEWKWLPSNPARNVTRPRESKGRIRYLSDDERERLLEACRRNAELYRIVVAALYTGARKGELEALRWRDVDTKRRSATFHETKNDETRTIPLPAPVIAVLGEEADPEALVFPSGANRRAWAKALSEARINGFRFHDLRHTAASYLAMSGASLLELAELLGHKTFEMVKRYAHLSPPHLSEVSDRMAEKFGGG